MKKIGIADGTLCREESTFSFKEKIEIARQLERLGVDVIELPPITNGRTDTLLVRTVSSFVKKSILAVAAGLDDASVDAAAAALSAAEKPRIRIELPMSPVGMEYSCHKKPPKMLEWISHIVSAAKEKCADVEFCAVDATRAEEDFLEAAVKAAGEAGATSVSVCDSAALLMPDEFAAFAAKVAELTSLPVSVACDNKNGLASAGAVLALRGGASGIKASVGGDGIPLESFAEMLRNCGDRLGLAAGIRFTELHRIIGQITWILGNEGNGKQAVSLAADSADEGALRLDATDSRETVEAAVSKLGYDLGDEDKAKVYEEFLRVASKKKVGTKELEAIVASTALQCPATYKLENYVINNGNIISASAQITLVKGEKPTTGVCIGDGPIDAAFRAIEQILGRHYELDDFQIQAVTEGKEAMGQALVRLRSGGKLYSASGISTDIIGASIRAYLGAVNKIVYEEA